MEWMGEILIAAAATGGIAHPTGYPFYLLLAGLFQFIPVGSLAFRTNLMSAIAATSAGLLVYGIIIKAISRADTRWKWLAALAGGMAFGLSPLLWSQAVITEVYTLNSLFVTIILFLSLNPLSEKFQPKYQDILIGLIFGLAMGNHITIIFLLPIIILTTVYRKPSQENERKWIEGWLIDGRSIVRRMIGMGVGLLVYLDLPFRAFSHPPVNWGNPVTFSGFTWLVSGALYQRLLMDLSVITVLARLQSVDALLLSQFGIIGLIVAFIGLIVFFKPTRLNFSLLWIVVSYSAFTIGYTTSDAFLYLIPVFICFTIWIGIGVGGVMQAASKRFRWSGIISGLRL